MDQLEKLQTGGVSPDGDSPINRDLWQTFLEKSWLVAAILIVSGALGYWVGAHSPVVYQSKSVLWLDTAETSVINIQEVMSSKGEYKGSQDLLNTIANNVKSSAILRRVVAANSLTNNPYFTGGTNILSEDQLVRILSASVDSRLRRMTRLIDVTAEAENPEMARLMAQSVVEEYIKQNSDDRTGGVQNAGQQLIVEERRIKENLEKAMRAVQEYVRTNNISLLNNADTVSEDYKSLSSQVLEATNERSLREREMSQVEAMNGKVETLLTLEAVAKSAEVVTLKDKLLTQEANVSNLELRYKDKHPAMIQARNELASFRKAFEEEVRRAPARIKLQLMAAIDKEKTLMRQLKEAESKLGEVARQRIEYDRLQGAVALEKNLHDSVVKRIREIDVTGGIEKNKNNVKIIEPANLPKLPIRPNKRMIFAYAMILGTALSFGLVWIIHLLDTTIKSVDQAERVFGLPVLGAVPKNKLVKDGRSRLFMSDDPTSLCAEAFRSLRASLALLGRESDRKVVLFTSAVPSEGKSFCCVNYAVSHAQQGKRTLVIDLDLRKPSLSETFGVKGDLAGATDVMLGKEPLDACVQKTLFDNLFLLTAGRPVPNPAELLSGPWAKQLIHEAVSKYDQVVLDNAPINAVSDTLLIVKEAQTVCLVMHAKKTSTRVVMRALEMLRRAGARPSGLVLNFLPQGAGTGYYYYYSGNKYYGSKGVYGSKA
ncbi:MAG: polysaccharide biosynthesis tyrosine autokinase [Proteobacteria bacterium]|nr:polysaccharide biosynthesis tyrosine autokinase [Pseudomonadota bacterium]